MPSCRRRRLWSSHHLQSCCANLRHKCSLAFVFMSWSPPLPLWMRLCSFEARPPFALEIAVLVQIPYSTIHGSLSTDLHTLHAWQLSWARSHKARKRLHHDWRSIRGAAGGARIRLIISQQLDLDPLDFLITVQPNGLLTACPIGSEVQIVSKKSRRGLLQPHHQKLDWRSELQLTVQGVLDAKHDSSCKRQYGKDSSELSQLRPLWDVLKTLVSLRNKGRSAVRSAVRPTIAGADCAHVQ